jgi:hypothetical protein
MEASVTAADGRRRRHGARGRRSPAPARGCRRVLVIYPLFTLGLIGTAMLAVPVLAGSCAYAI